MTYYLKTVSVSQMLAYERDPFYWGLAYLERLPRCSSEALEFGIEAHDIFSKIVKKKEVMIPKKYEEFVNIFKNKEEKILDYGYDVISESRFAIYDRDLNIRIVGVIDATIWNYFSDCPLIADFKFLSNIKYYKGASDLKNDLQMMLYAHYVYQVTKMTKNTCRGVWLKYIQFFKKGKIKYRSSYTFVCKERIRKFYSEEILPRINKLKSELNKVNKSEDGIFELTRDRNKACFYYGPGSCEYEGIYDSLITIEEYKLVYKGLRYILDRKPRSKEIIGVCRNKNLTNNVISCIINSVERDGEVSKKLNIKKLEQEIFMNSNNTTNRKFGVSIITPTVEAVFSHLVDPVEDLSGKLKFEVNLRLDPTDERHTKFMGLLKDTTKKLKKELDSKNTFRELSFREDMNKDKETTGKVLLKTTSKRKPVIVNKANEEITLNSELPVNTKIRVKLLALPYDWAGNSGVSFYIQKVQVVEMPETITELEDDVDFPVISNDVF
jgi:hypothetical protein